MDWFAVDKEGLASLLERKGKSRAVLELLQNSFDEDGVTRVSVTLSGSGQRGRSLLIVEDDAPDGFADLTHAFTLFAPSKKVSDATKRGRFNLGEKLVLAIADEATVISTRGGYRFDAQGRHVLRRTTGAGSIFRAVIRLNAAEREEVKALVHTLLAPAHIAVTINDQPLLRRSPVRVFPITLRTEVADVEGILRGTRRATTVRLFDPVGDEVPHIYEMGIPVVEHDGRWHVDVGQKVPLSFERDNVTPAYLRDLRVAVLNNTADLLTADDAATGWVKDAAGDARTDDAAVQQVMVKRFGEKSVAFDPSDPQANAEAVLQGFTVVHGGSLSRDEWAQARRAGVLPPAGQVTPSNSTVHTSPYGTPPIDEEDWTPGMMQVATYAAYLGEELLGRVPTVDIHRSLQGFSAAFNGHTLMLNLTRLGHRWFDEPDQQKIDALLIHEFAHDRVSNHLSEDFHTELCRLGAALREINFRLTDVKVSAESLP